MRAVAIDVSINTTAGGFILPNDRVDIVEAYREPELTKEHGFDVLGSELVVTNVRVLAIGPAVETKNGEPVATGDATLGLDPVQAERCCWRSVRGRCCWSCGRSRTRVPRRTRPFFRLRRPTAR